MKNFAITGVAGYIAPRHLKAIKDTGNRLIAAVDPHDSVGILDRYFQNVSFFTEIERFDRHLEKLKRNNSEHKLDYLSIYSPNYLHDSHIRLALRLGVDAICEKPLLLKPSNLDYLEELEQETEKKIYNILQLRLHPSLLKLKQEIDLQPNNKKYDVVLTYITSRGPWYKYSWKGTEEKSGGIAFNIGIHFFDMLLWIFGKEIYNESYLKQQDKMSGYLELEKANVNWYLSLDRNDLPQEVAKKGLSTYRSISINGNEIEFTDGFTDLHTVVYQNILAGKGFGISDVRPSIELVDRIRNSKIKTVNESAHPFSKFL